MPFYSFKCEQCGEAFDVRASIKQKEEGLTPECPSCHSQETRQVITAGLMIGRGNDGGISFPACGPTAGPGCC